jgi:hypothetical protein
MSTIRLMLLAGCMAGAVPAFAKDVSYIGSVHVVRGDAAGDMARGTVFLDANRNAMLDQGEAGVAGVLVSNGLEVVATDASGTYELPAYDDMNLFITKPAGYAVPVDQDMVPQFNYIHKLAGSPPLRYGGIEPTGPLPQAINFPLIEDNVGDEFQCLVFGDPQPYNNRELSYVRDTVGRMLATRDHAATECLLFEGDILGDDLSLYPRFKQVISIGGVPQYYVAGNHDLDFDAVADADSYDTFRREWGPEYYSFDIGQVHFVVLDDVRYPCNGVDPHPFCDPSEESTYTGVIHDRQMAWLRNDLAQVPADRLIVLNAHIPFVSFTDATSPKHQVSNLAELYEIIGDRPALGLSGHTHTVEQIVPGEHFAGWQENTGTGPAPFHQIITGAVAGSWWTGDLDDQGVPHATMRLGEPRGYYVFEFAGPDYMETYVRFGGTADEQMHVSFNTPRFREWAELLFAYTEIYEMPSDILPPVTVNDLGDMSMLTVDDLAGGTWVTVNVWNGSRESTVSVSIDDGAPIMAARTQPGDGEDSLWGVEYTDPYAVARQATQGRISVRSVQGGEATAGFTTGRGDRWEGVAGPFSADLLTRRSSHLWRADLPTELSVGMHTLEVVTVDRYGRTFRDSSTFEVVESVPPMDWQEGYWN